MPKRYEVRERSFINGRLCEPGDIVTLEIDGPGSNLRLLDTTSQGSGAGKQSAGALVPPFAAARTGGGKFLVKDAEGQVAGDFTGTKAEAEAEAERLNAGAQSSIAPPPAQVDAGGLPTPTIPATEAGGAGDEEGSGLPDA